MNEQEISQGMKVSFEARGQKHEGVVTRVRIKNRRKLAALEERLCVRFGLSSRYMVAEITVDKTLWTVPTSRCTIITKAAPEERDTAHQVAQEVKSSYTNRIYARKTRNYEAARDNGLMDLKANAQIEVKFRDVGWQPRFFVRFNTSGSVVYRDRFNNERRTPTQFVRLPRPEGEPIL